MSRFSGILGRNGSFRSLETDLPLLTHKHPFRFAAFAFGRLRKLCLCPPIGLAEQCAEIAAELEEDWLTE
jgi:hypothetical protein